MAAVTLAGAAATAELVLTLASRRRSLEQHRPSLVAACDTLRDLRRRFLEAADADLAVLEELLAAHQARKEAIDDRRREADDRYRRALLAAAESTLALAEDGARLLDLLHANVPYPTRFTVSDLGAAAAMASGAIEAALLTGEVNIVLLGADAPETLVARLRAARDRHRLVAEQVVRATRERIGGTAGGNHGETA